MLKKNNFKTGANRYLVLATAIGGLATQAVADVKIGALLSIERWTRLAW